MTNRLKLDFEDPQLTESKSSTTIIDVNDDCLVEIFKFLNLKDLLNVRATTSRFKISTGRAFARKQRKLPTSVSNGEHLELSINVLKQFGEFVSKLHVCYKMEKFELLMQAIVKHCGKTLTELEFFHVKEDWFFGLHRTSVRRMQRQLRELRTKFPILASLAFAYNDYVGCPYSDDIIQPIPTLTTFSACGLMFSHEDICKFMALNSQLKSLDLWVPNGFVTQSFVDEIDASLPNLKSLELNRVTIEGTLNYPMPSTRFKNLRKLTFGRVSDFYAANGLTSLFGEEIEELELHSGNYFIANFVESISQFKKLTQFTVNLVESLSDPSLEAFDMSIVSSTAVKELILGNKQLTKVVIIWHHQLKDFHIRGKKYRNVVKEKLNGARWRMDEWCEDTSTMHCSFEMEK